jgi:hypothetical protein
MAAHHHGSRARGLSSLPFFNTRFLNSLGLGTTGTEAVSDINHSIRVESSARERAVSAKGAVVHACD